MNQDHSFVTILYQEDILILRSYGRLTKIYKWIIEWVRKRLMRNILRRIWNIVFCIKFLYRIILSSRVRLGNSLWRRVNKCELDRKRFPFGFTEYQKINSTRSLYKPVFVLPQDMGVWDIWGMLFSLECWQNRKWKQMLYLIS